MPPPTPRPSQAQRAESSRQGAASLTASPSKRARDSEEREPSTPRKRQATEKTHESPLTPSSALSGQRSTTTNRAVSSSTTAGTDYNSPPGSQMSDVSEYEVAIQTDALPDEADEVARQEHFFGAGGRNASFQQNGASYHLPSVNGHTEDEEDEVEDEVATQSGASRGPAAPGQWDQTVGSQGRNPMPTPPHTSQRVSRIGRSTSSRGMSEEEPDTPTKSSTSKGKQRAVSNFTGMTDPEQPRALSSGSQSHTPPRITSQDIANVRGAAEIMNRLVDDNARLSAENVRLNDQIEKLETQFRKYRRALKELTDDQGQD
ncbi:hypothetical protein EUX98_g3337 [Antrodiella citrinella]|uniref:Uncharacterized protein n=1 Tax=Antrodiella citrinella TaxID=2447956 RepID=A0A4S4MYW7_9APHY|nr:hypothetical protein EUX98_g3337 [Antrodiella citrinella]